MMIIARYEKIISKNTNLKMQSKNKCEPEGFVGLDKIVQHPVLAPETLSEKHQGWAGYPAVPD